MGSILDVNPDWPIAFRWPKKNPAPLVLRRCVLWPFDRADTTIAPLRGVAATDQPNPAARAAFHKVEIAKWWPIIKDANSDRLVN
jgi:hypothetical protein